VALQNKAAAEATVFAVRQDEAADEPTHSRVIEHTEQLVSARAPARHRTSCGVQNFQRRSSTKQHGSIATRLTTAMLPMTAHPACRACACPSELQQRCCQHVKIAMTSTPGWRPLGEWQQLQMYCATFTVPSTEQSPLFIHACSCLRSGSHTTQSTSSRQLRARLT
jgi:hypothetical protein